MVIIGLNSLNNYLRELWVKWGIRMRVRGWSVKSFEDATAIIKYLNFLLGVRILERPRGQLRPYLSIVYISCLSFALIANTLNLDGLKVFKNYLLKFENFIYQGMYFVTIIALNSFCLFGLFNSRQFLKYKKIVLKIEEEIEQLGGWIDNPAVFKRCVVCISLWFSYITITVIFYMQWIASENSISTGVALGMAYAFGETVIAIVLIDFVTAVHWLKLSYEQTNLLLCKGFCGSHIPRTKPVVEVDKDEQINTVTGRFCPNTEGKASTSVRLEAFQSIKVVPKLCNERLWIWRIRQVHLELCRGTKFVFSIYAIQMAIEVGLILMVTTSKLYYFYVEFSVWKRTIVTYSNLTILSTADCIVLGMKLYLICATCEYMLREVKHTNEILHNLPHGSNDFEFREEVHQFVLQITHYEQSLTIFGFPKLNFKFIQMFFNALTTYLVIMIQMSHSVQSHGGDLRNNTFKL